ncbi:MAG: ATP-binding cassette domain-containing protein [Candidatus Thorarchaeota archaeon]
MQSVKNIIIVKNLKKHFGQIKAVDGIDLEVRKGEIFSLLGPNGAGKSTTIRMLTTVLTVDGGNATVSGHNISTLNGKVAIRGMIGVCPQEITIYDDLNAEENTTFVAKMHDMSSEEATAKASALLKKLGLADRKDRTKNFSGGMKRRLNLAMALVHEPHIAFLDEPTAGLDPQASRIVWDIIRGLKDSGMTVVLTTHDMDEADTVSDHVAIIDNGKIIAYGSPDALKEKFGRGNVIEIGFFDQDKLDVAKEKIEKLDAATKITEFGERKILVTFSGGMKTFFRILNESIESVEDIENMSFRQNSLEDVFLHLTGRRLRDN